MRKILSRFSKTDRHADIIDMLVLNYYEDSLNNLIYSLMTNDEHVFKSLSENEFKSGDMLGEDGTHIYYEKFLRFIKDFKYPHHPNKLMSFKDLIEINSDVPRPIPYTDWVMEELEGSELEYTREEIRDILSCLITIFEDVCIRPMLEEGQTEMRIFTQLHNGRILLLSV